MKLILLTTIAFLFTFRCIPLLIKLANKFDIYENQSERKLYLKKTSYLGGIAIAGGFLLSFLLSSCLFGLHINSIHFSILMGLIVIFFHGLGDDIFEYSSKKKLLFQLMLAFLLVNYGGLRISHLERFLPFNEIPEYLGTVLNMLIFMTIVNAFNLIDGADGITTVSALIPCIYFAVVFISNDQWVWGAMAAALTGSLVSYFLFNKPPAYIFMGDNGSLFIGTLLASFCIYFIDHGNTFTHQSSSARVITAFAVISLPILDLLRLFFYRLINKRSPFSADREHIHHLFMNLLQKTWDLKLLLLVAQVQIFITLFALLMKNGNWFYFITACTIGYFLFIKGVKILIAQAIKNKANSQPITMNTGLTIFPEFELQEKLEMKR